MSKEAQFALSIATVRPTYPDVAILTLGQRVLYAGGVYQMFHQSWPQAFQC
jgi:hypothetical protein